MLRLKWEVNTLIDSDGEPTVVHYLFDEVSLRCFAMIPEPRAGNLIYATDIRVAGFDRAYMDLEAAKSYCEGVAIEDDIKCAKEAADNIRVAEDAPRPGALRRLLARIKA